MKKMLIVLALLLLLVAGYYFIHPREAPPIEKPQFTETITSTTPKSYPKEELEKEFGYKIEADIPEIPKESKVVVLETPQVDENYVIEEAKKFNVRSDNVTERKNYYRIFDGRYAVKVYKKSGAVFFQDTKKLFKISEVRYSLKEEDAKRIADEVLRKYNLLPENPHDKMVFYRIRHLYSSTSDGKLRIEDTEVIYRREIDGIKVLGPGSVVVVYLDNQGNLIGVYRDWKPLKEISEKMENINIKEAFSRMKAQDEKWNLKTGEITVKSILFGYYDGGRYSDQRYFQPSLVFKREYGKNEVIRGYIAIPTLKEVIEEIEN